MRPSVFCLLDSSDFHMLYPFSILRLSCLSVHMSSSVWPFPFPPVCHPHCLELHPSLLVSRQSLSPLLFHLSLKATRALCCLRSLSAAMLHSFLWISFIHYASLQIFFFSFLSLSLKCYSNGGSAQANGNPRWTNHTCPHLLGFVVSSTATLRSRRTGSISKISYYPTEMSNKSFVCYISIHFQFEQLFLPGVEDLH